MKTILILPLALLASCASEAIYSGLTGAPIPSTPVKRLEGGTPINVVSRNLEYAEANPSRVYGLYDATAVAERVGELQSSSK